MYTLEGYDDWVMQVIFSPDGTQLLTGSEDRTARFRGSTREQAREQVESGTIGMARRRYQPDPLQTIAGKLGRDAHAARLVDLGLLGKWHGRRAGWQGPEGMLDGVQRPRWLDRPSHHDGHETRVIVAVVELPNL